MLFCFFSLGIVFMCLVYANAGEGPCGHIDVDWLKQHAPIPSAEIVSRHEVGEGGLCEVILKTRGDYVPLYAGRDFFIAGAMHKDHVQVTGRKIDNLKKGVFVKYRNRVDDAAVIEYTPPHLRNGTIYMFTDPLCPYCKKAGPQVKKIAERYGMNIKLLFFNVHGADGEKKMIEAICRNFSLDQYLDEVWIKEETGEKYRCEKGKEKYDLSMKESQQLGIRGVPQFYLDDGTSINGANVKALEWLVKALPDPDNVSIEEQAKKTSGR